MVHFKAVHVMMIKLYCGTPLFNRRFSTYYYCPLIVDQKLYVYFVIIAELCVMLVLSMCREQSNSQPNQFEYPIRIVWLCRLAREQSWHRMASCSWTPWCCAQMRLVQVWVLLSFVKSIKTGVSNKGLSRVEVEVPLQQLADG
jgi:hypothetical protein